MTAGGKQALYNVGAGALRSRRRGHHARAVLADDPRADQAGRRAAGARAHVRRRTASRCTRTPAARRDHAAHARHHHQLAVQSDRCAHLGRGARRDRRCGRARASIWIVLDLCYERLIYDPVPHNLPKVLADRMRDRTVLAGSASKAYAMTGWRCGWALGPAAVIAACNALPEPLDVERLARSRRRRSLAALTGPQDA